MNKSNLYIIPDIELIDEYTRLAKDEGIHFEYNDFHVPKELDNKALIEERINVYQNAKDIPSGCTLHGSFMDVTIFSTDDVIREHSEYRIRESLEIAKKLSAKAIIIHTNFVPNYEDNIYENGWITMNASFIKEVLREYPDISIYMENMFDMSPYRLGVLAKELKEEERFGICLDYAHASVFGKVDMEEWFATLSPYIKHMHINDNDLTHDSHQALGTGSIDYKRFFELYEKYTKDATVLIEVRGMDKIKTSLDYLNKANIYS